MLTHKRWRLTTWLLNQFADATLLGMLMHKRIHVLTLYAYILGHQRYALGVYLLLAKPVSDHHVMTVTTVTTVTSVTLMTNCDWVRELKRPLSLTPLVYSLLSW